MANEHRGEVAFESEGQSYVLKLSTNKMIAIENESDALPQGLARTRFILFHALRSVESQKALTLDDAGDLMDDLGLTTVNELLEQTKWGSMAKKAIEAQKAKQEADKVPVSEGSARPS